jgi:hypothetical protein
MPDEPCHCCCSDESLQAGGRCPDCDQPGHTVSGETLQALLTARAKALLLPGSYYFCDTPECPAVYFAADGASRFGKDDLTVRVGSKETDPSRPLCYCLGHTYESIRDEWERTGQTTAMAEIEAATRAGSCRCRVTNPRGSCCLPQVRQFIAELEGTPS